MPNLLLRLLFWVRRLRRTSVVSEVSIIPNRSRMSLISITTMISFSLIISSLVGFFLGGGTDSDQERGLDGWTQLKKITHPMTSGQELAGSVTKHSQVSKYDELQIDRQLDMFLSQTSSTMYYSAVLEVVELLRVPGLVEEGEEDVQSDRQTGCHTDYSASDSLVILSFPVGLRRSSSGSSSSSSSSSELLAQLSAFAAAAAAAFFFFLAFAAKWITISKPRRELEVR